jgi:hypothetical protein
VAMLNFSDILNILDIQQKMGFWWGHSTFSTNCWFSFVRYCIMHAFQNVCREMFLFPFHFFRGTKLHRNNECILGWSKDVMIMEILWEINILSTNESPRKKNRTVILRHVFSKSYEKREGAAFYYPLCLIFTLFIFIYLFVCFKTKSSFFQTFHIFIASSVSIHFTKAT